MPCLVNAVNFMDGINGITSLTMVVWGVTALAVGYADNSAALVALGGATAGAAIGFLPYNAPSARMFLGDVGSYLFGGLVGCGIQLGWADGASVAVLAAPLSLYAADTGSALLRRAMRGERLTDAHREHVYQRLTSDVGIPHFVVSAYAAGSATLTTLIWWEMPWTPTAVLSTMTLVSIYLFSASVLMWLKQRAVAR
jgi:UDP-N-acetylmuramyl pentapeptide phosphotransferase/UDP-N-acetylglucosamine-1-phosphate transferase